MGKQSKGRSRPMPDADNVKAIIFSLEEALSHESHFTCNHSDRKPWEVSMSARSEAVEMMRFLKIWYDLPHKVFFTAASYLDHFLARLKVQEKFLACLSVSCFSLATSRHGFTVDTSQLVMLTQSKCSVKDVERMCNIIKQKLSLDEKDLWTPLDLLKIFMDIFKYIAIQFKGEALLSRMLQWDQLCTRLEVLICDLPCVLQKTSVFTLAFLHFQMERFLSREVPGKSNYYSMEMFYILAIMIELQSLCNVNSEEYALSFNTVTKVLKEYDARKKKKDNRQLNLKFSTSTHIVAKSIHGYYSLLRPIQEE